MSSELVNYHQGKKKSLSYIMDNLRKLSVAVRQESKMLEIIRKRIDNTAEDKIISPSNSVVHLHLAHHVQF